MLYQFTDDQLSRLLHGTLEIFREFRDVHGQDEDSASINAVLETLGGLDAEIELVAHGEIETASMQIIDSLPANAQPAATIGEQQSA